MSDFIKVVHFTYFASGAQQYPVFAEITFKGGNLSISGVEGPQQGGNCRGGCGQIDIHLRDQVKDLIPALGWTRDLIQKFLDIWGEWHLNDLQPGCEHQQAAQWGEVELTVGTQKKLSRWVYPSEHPEGVLGKPCPVCGYKYGAAWRRREVPQEVLDFLRNLPETEITPVWV